MDGGSLYKTWTSHIYDYDSDTVFSCGYYPKLTIKYNANGGSSTPSSQTKYLGDRLTLASAISRSYYSFRGWSTSSSATTASWSAGQVIDYEAWNSTGASGFSNSGWNVTTPSVSNGTITLYAVWAGNVYTIAYNKNGGSSTPSTQSVTYPNSATLAAAISRSNGTSTSNVTITITYNKNSGSSTPSNSTGTAVNTTTTTYTFEKWHLNSTSGTAYAAKASYKPTSNVTMYAGWTSSSSTSRTSNPSIKLAAAISRANGSTTGYSVTYNANGGSGAPSSQTSGDRTITYAFGGWNTNNSGTGTNYSANTSYTFSANTTLYAKWTGTTSNDSSWTCSSTTPTRSNYTFKGWSTSSSATSASYTAGTTYTITSAKALYAVWSLNAPSGVTHTAVQSRDKIKVTASYTGAEISDIIIYYRANSTGSYSSKSLGTSTSGEITGLTPNTNYQIYVKVTNASGDSSSTAAVVKTGAYLPESPSVSVSNIEALSVTATVSAIGETNAAITNYKVYYTKKISTNTGNMALRSLSDGSLWARCFYHNVKEGENLFTSLAEGKSVNTATKFSVLGNLSAYKYSDGKYEFMLRYPNQSSSQYNRWKQTNSPIDEFITTTSSGTGTATGYAAVHIDWATNYWGGMTRQNNDTTAYTPCLLSGSVGHSNWFYALASASSYEYGMPSSSAFETGSTWGSVELYVRIPDATVTTVDCGTNTSTSITGLEEETEYTMWMSATNAGGTNYSKAINFTTPADIARIRYKVNGAWQQGKTYYKDNGTWKKVKKIYKKVDGTWKIGTNN